MRSGIALCSLLLLTSCASRVGGSICLLPQGYIGPVLIIYGQKDGDPPEIERGLHVYRIPATGVVRTRNEYQRKIEAREYYYVDSAGTRSPIHLKLPDHYSGHDTIRLTREGSYCFNDMEWTYGSLKYRTFGVADEQRMDSVDLEITRLQFKLDQSLER